MKARQTLFVVVLLLIVAGGVLLWWKQGGPRRDSIQALHRLDDALRSGDAAQLIQIISPPSAIQGRTIPEQTEFLTKALRDEISAEGLAVLQREGNFGSLTNLFPAEAAGWAQQAGVRLEDCVAFKLERNGLRAEVVLVGDSTLRTSHSVFRVVRCNNVKQLAQKL